MCPPICRTQTFGAGSDQDNLWLDGVGPLFNEEKPPVFLVQTHDEEFDNAIRTLWGIDQVPETSKLSSEEEQAVHRTK